MALAMPHCPLLFKYTQSDTWPISASSVIEKAERKEPLLTLLLLWEKQKMLVHEADRQTISAWGNVQEKKREKKKRARNRSPAPDVKEEEEKEKKKEKRREIEKHSTFCSSDWVTLFFSSPSWWYTGQLVMRKTHTVNRRCCCCCCGCKCAKSNRKPIRHIDRKIVSVTAASWGLCMFGQQPQQQHWLSLVAQSITAVAAADATPACTQCFFLLKDASNVANVALFAVVTAHLAITFFLFLLISCFFSSSRISNNIHLQIISLYWLAIWQLTIFFFFFICFSLSLVFFPPLMLADACCTVISSFEASRSVSVSSW